MIVSEKTNKLVMTAMMICLIAITTMFLKVPIPFANGYVHLGDAMIFISVLVLGWKYGAAAAAIGSALGDIMGGYPIWAPWTLCIKGIMAIIMGLVIAAFIKQNAGKSTFRMTMVQLVGMGLAGIWMTAGYYIAEGLIYGNWIAPMLGVPWNIGQFVVGIAIAVAVSAALYKTPAKRFFL